MTFIADSQGMARDWDVLIVGQGMACDQRFMLKARVWLKIREFVMSQGRMGQVLLMARLGHAIGVILAVQP